MWRKVNSEPMKYIFTLLLLSVSFVYGQVDTLIVGPTGDYASLQAAFDSYDSVTITKPQLILIEDGRYKGKCSIKPIEGASATNTVTVSSQSMDTAAVRLYNYTDFGHYHTTTGSVITIEGADYITFQYISIESANDAAASCIEFQDSAKHNIIQHVSFPSPYWRSSYDDAYTILIQNGSDSNRIENCSFRGDGYSIYAQASSKRPIKRLEVKNCTMSDIYLGVAYFYYIHDFEFEGNKVHHSRTSAAKGLNIHWCTKGGRIVGNEFNGFGRQLTLYGFRGDSTLNNAVLANNIFREARLSYSYSEWLNIQSVRDVLFLHNTMVGAAETLIYFETSINNTFKHNIVINASKGSSNYSTGEGEIFYFKDMTNPFKECDGNVYSYVSDEFFYGNDGYTASRLEFDEYQEEFGQDQNSIMVYPEFYRAYNYRLKHTDDNLSLSNITSTLPITLKDIDGDVRRLTNPTPGADEIITPTIELELVRFMNDTVRCDGSNDIKIAFENIGSDSIYTASFSLIVNDSIVSNTTWNGGIASRDSIINFQVGTIQVSEDSSYYVQVILDSVAIVGKDMYAYNDTLQMNMHGGAYQGQIIVSADSTEFPTIQSAIDSLTNRGVCGQTTIALIDSFYEEAVRVPFLKGSTKEHYVVLESFEQDSSSTKFDSKSGYQLGYALNLDGATHFKVKHLTLTGNPVQITENSSNVEFANNFFWPGYKPSNLLSSQYGIYSYHDHPNNIIVRNNRFQYLEHGLEFTGTTSVSEDANNIQVHQNIFDTCQYGILVYRYTDVFITGNLFRNGYSNAAGITVDECHQTVKIQQNDLNLKYGKGISITSCENETDSMFLVNSNMIIGQLMDEGIHLEESDHIAVLHNSIHAKETAYNKILLSINESSDIDVFNNLFSMDHRQDVHRGVGLYVYNSDNYRFDNNGYSLYTKFFGRLLNDDIQSNEVSHLQEWQAQLNQDLNSVTVLPNYIHSDSNLHITNYSPILGVAKSLDYTLRDIDNELFVNVLGADQFTQAQYTQDLSLNEIIHPTGCGSDSAIYIAVKNEGDSLIQQFTVVWTLRDSIQDTVSINLALSNNEDTVLFIGNKAFDGEDEFFLKAWIHSVNNGLDTNAGNDTMRTSVFKPKMSGTYTVGDSTADFLKIQDALDALKEGVCGPVVIDVKSGTYAVELDFSLIYGTDSINTITFQSEARHSDSVILESKWDEIILVNKVGNLIFRDFTLLSDRNKATMQLNESNGTLIDNVVFKVEGNNSGSQLYLGSCDDLIVQNCSFYCNEAYAIQLYGSYASTLDDSYNCVIRNNEFIDHHGNSAVYFHSSINGLIQNNTITHSDTSKRASLAFNIYSSRQTKIESNRVKGAYNNVALCSWDYDTYFINNEFIQECIGNFDQVSVIAYSSYNAFSSRFVNNSFLQYGVMDTTSQILLRSSDDFDFFNNTFVNLIGGKVFDMYPMEGDSILNNNFFTNGREKLEIGNTLIYDFDSIPGADILDSSNIYVNPNFMSYDYLIPTTDELKNVGLELSEVNVDIDGNARDNSPDIGAYEYDLNVNDVSIISLSEQKDDCDDSELVTVDIRNIGQGQLTSMVLSWSVNDTVQPVINWSGAINYNDTLKALQLGTYNYLPNIAYTTKVWVDSINGVLDENPMYDTITFENNYVAMKGEYVVGSGTSHFVTPAEAASAVSHGGVCGPVHIKILDGTYAGQVEIDSIYGVDSNNTVLFESFSKDATMVEITGTASEDSVYIVRVNQANYVTFKHLTFSSDSTVATNVILIENGADNFTIDSCVLYGDTVANNRNYAVFNAITSRDHNMTISNNTVIGGMNGIRAGGGHYDGERNLLIYQNHVINVREEYINFDDAVHPIIEANIITGDSASYDGLTRTGIEIESCMDGMRVVRNQIDIYNGDGIDMAGIYDVYDRSSIIANNSIIIHGDTIVSGIRAFDNDRGIVHHNSVLILNTHEESYALKHTANGVTVYNNSFTNLGGGLAMIYSGYSYSYFDYNNYYALDTMPILLSYSSQNRNTWNEWIVDHTAYRLDPQYVSEGDLHIKITSPLIDAGMPSTEYMYASLDSLDIDGDIRDGVYDIGMDEFDIGDVSVELIEVSYGERNCEGTNRMYLTFRNDGDAILRSVEFMSVLENDTLYGEWGGALNAGDTIFNTLIAEGTFGVDTFGGFIHSSIDIDTLNINDSIVFEFVVSENPIVNIKGDSVLCMDSQVLMVDDQLESYVWYTSDDTLSNAHSVQVFNDETVFVKAVDSNSCFVVDTFSFVLRPSYSPDSLLGAYSKCFDDSAYVVALNQNDSVEYLWINAQLDSVSTQNEAILIDSGYYSVEVSDVCGVIYESNFNLVFYAQAIVDLGSDINLADTSGTIELDAGNFEEYNWSNGYQDSMLIFDVDDIVGGAYNYSVTVTDSNGCISSDAILLFTDYSISAEGLNGIQLLVYPNPSAGIVMLEMEGVIKMELFDAQGSLVRAENGQDKLQLDLQDLAPGMYCIRIDIEGNTMKRMLMIE